MALFKVTTNQRTLMVRTDTAMHAKEELNFGTRDGWQLTNAPVRGSIRWMQGEMIETVEEVAE
jgi:hypothetical protein